MPSDKPKFALRMEPETQALVRQLYKSDNCRSQSQFIEKAVRFYCGYILQNHTTEFLNNALLPAMKGIVQDSENRIRQNLFKQAVEVALNTRVISTYEGIEALQLARMRGEVIMDLKRTNGGLRLEDAVRDKTRREKDGDK